MYSTKTREDSYRRILQVKGNANQIKKAKEECKELLKALEDYEAEIGYTGQYEQYVPDVRQARIEEAATAIEEECADVYNMINQLAIMFGFSKRLEGIADIKTHKVLEDIRRESEAEANFTETI